MIASLFPLQTFFFFIFCHSHRNIRAQTSTSISFSILTFSRRKESRMKYLIILAVVLVSSVANGQSDKARCVSEAMDAIRQFLPSKYIEQVNKMIECKNVSFSTIAWKNWPLWQILYSPMWLKYVSDKRMEKQTQTAWKRHWWQLVPSRVTSEWWNSKPWWSVSRTRMNFSLRLWNNPSNTGYTHHKTKNFLIHQDYLGLHVRRTDIHGTRAFVPSSSRTRCRGFGCLHGSNHDRTWIQC